MANLPEDTLAIVLELQKQLLYLLDRASATEYSLIERYGETSETIPELDELQNVKERAWDLLHSFPSGSLTDRPRSTPCLF